MKKTLAIVLFLLMSLTLFSACGDDAGAPGGAADGSVEQAADGEEEPIIVDSAGHELGAEVASDGKIMVGGKVYIESNVVLHDFYGDMDAMDTITSFVDLSETPTEEGQSNFDSVGAPYIRYGNGLAVYLDEMWIYFMPME
ncbi:MAG: hypothetical protein Q4B50_08255 [Bacillota bacterium]|nr:hypothetical protein [Bacillota bacterium]